ncbi:hypothetical protein LHYA1_G002399 [Lachnellula hyalina]|uniref:Suppressor protein SRP40 n=1 Tax=Lachnellula hyalina TaxID=1316788 RepID=A0A8H8R6Q3_9HELO|nr:uncharacterized protein LHYA1_G002399 [Lachnellula hyalina]TVY28700.1 hypothetical protein LHYA1_G002399 [Lachnellula hyalina]
MMMLKPSRDAENIPPNPNLQAQSSPTKTSTSLYLHVIWSQNTPASISPPSTPPLLATILPPSVLPNARNISYHTIETFPEKAYGYVELPIMDAEKIKKKLNGSILKGTKIRIEKARPDKEPPIAEEPEQAKKKPKKRKRDSTIPGVDIGERSVKRGWTVPGKPDKDKKKIKSKYTTGSECLFKTVVPPNVAANAKSMDGKTDKKHRKAGKEALVHEFSKSTKYATFLRDNAVAGGSKAVEFVEGKGWVDEEGNVLEEVKKSQKTPKVESKVLVAERASKDDKDESSSEEESDHDNTVSTSKVPTKPAQDESSDESSSEEEITSPSASAPTLVPQAAEEDTETSTSGSSSSESDSESDSSESSESSESESALQPSPRPLSRPQSSSGPPISLSIKIPSAISTPAHTVHPLEALYKKPKPDDGVAPEPDVPSFNFFGADGDVDEEMDEVPNQVPLTPFTQRDFEYRGMRSAAPTPDTAHPNKRFVWPTENSDDEDDDVPTSPIRKGSSSKEGEKKEGASAESDFQKWFYENRGDTSRAWKKRRRTVAKEKRHRENRKRGERAA